MPIFHKNRQNLQSAKTDKSQQILQDKTTENHSNFCQNLENAVEPKTKKSAFFAAKKSTPINKKHPQKNLTPTQSPRKKFLKIFAAASLALITCATTLLAVAPFGVGAAANAATNTNLSNNTQTTSPLGLDPENDPVLFTTSSGLDIKFSSGNLTSGALDGYGYFSMGSYDGELVNWVIIGCNSSTSAPTEDTLQWFSSWYEGNKNLSFVEYLGDVTTPAGSAIHDDSNAPKKQVMYSLITSVTNAVENTTELFEGEFLCISEKVLYNSTATATYAGSTMQLTINALYDNLNLTAFEQERIVPQTIVSHYNYYGHLNTCENQYLFLLARSDQSASQNFGIETYLTTPEVRIAETDYWLRTGTASSGNAHCQFVNTVGNYSHVLYTNKKGIRPAMVIKL